MYERGRERKIIYISRLIHNFNLHYIIIWCFVNIRNCFVNTSAHYINELNLLKLLHGLKPGFLHHKNRVKNKEKNPQSFGNDFYTEFNFPFPTDNSRTIILCHVELFIGKGKLLYHFLHIWSNSVFLWRRNLSTHPNCLITCAHMHARVQVCV